MKRFGEVLGGNLPFKFYYKFLKSQTNFIFCSLSFCYFINFKKKKKVFVISFKKFLKKVGNTFFDGMYYKIYLYSQSLSIFLNLTYVNFFKIVFKIIIFLTQTFKTF